MDSDERGNGEKGDARPKSKQGSRNFLACRCVSVKLSMMQKQLVQLDRLAVEIRAAGGSWITRSGIITAIVEAASRADAVSEQQTLGGAQDEDYADPEGT